MLRTPPALAASPTPAPAAAPVGRAIPLQGGTSDWDERETWTLDSHDTAAARPMARIDAASVYDVWDRRTEAETEGWCGAAGLYAEADNDDDARAISYGIAAGAVVP